MTVLQELLEAAPAVLAWLLLLLLLVSSPRPCMAVDRSGE
jgi:hypothetical protein